MWAVDNVGLEIPGSRAHYIGFLTRQALALYLPVRMVIAARAASMLLLACAAISHSKSFVPFMFLGRIPKST